MTKKPSLLASMMIVFLFLFAVTSVWWPTRILPIIHAQNNGVVGLLAEEFQVFNAQTTTKSSAIFTDIGQGLNILFYCDTAFIGTIDLEWSPTTQAPSFMPLQVAQYAAADTGCHVLTVNGYFPNLRSTVTPTSGSLSAWYSASSGPVGYATPAIGSNGPVSPPLCDQEGATAISNSATSVLGVVAFSGSTTILCGMTVSFNGATTAGNIQLGWSTTAACSSPLVLWVSLTTANTPQTFPVTYSIRSPTPVQSFPCVINNSGTTVEFSYNYMILHV